MTGVPDVGAEDVGFDPVRLVLHDSHQVVAELGHPPRLAGNVLPRRPEEDWAREVGTPESGGSAILEDQPIAVHLDDSVAAGGTIVGVEEREVHRGHIPPQRMAKPARVRPGVTLVAGGDDQTSFRQGHRQADPGPARADPVAHEVSADLVARIPLDRQPGHRVIEPDHDLLAWGGRPPPAGLVEEQLGIAGLTRPAKLNPVSASSSTPLR